MKRSEANVLEREIAMKRELACEVLRSFGTLRLQVTGHSMLPAIWPGDVLVIERAEIGEVSVNDVVLCVREGVGRLFAHRIVRTQPRRDGVQAITQGDALRVPDAPVSESHLLGKVTRIVRNGRHVRPCATGGLAQKIAAALVRRSELLARILVHVHLARGSSRAW